ncbi:MAG: hypothetical protein GXP01_09805 [Alphaproteobacteria bacterium]|nr:hypothetical protein [Alphaproteobacteria bacterium]
MEKAVVTEMQDPKSGAKYQLIHPPNQPHTRVTSTGTGGIDTGGINAADKAVQQHSHEFSGWIDDWLDALLAALERFRADPDNPLAAELLTAAAHEVKGGGTMANAPALTALANPLCDLLERVENAAPHLDLIEIGVGALDAARRENRYDLDEKIDTVVTALDSETRKRTAGSGKKLPPAQAAGSAGV